MEGAVYFSSSSVPKLPDLDLPFPEPLANIGPLDLLPLLDSPLPDSVSVADIVEGTRERLAPDVDSAFADSDLQKVASRHRDVDHAVTVVSSLANMTFGPELWSNDLSSRVALIGGRSKEGALCVTLRAGSYSISPTSKAAVVFAGEFVLSYLDEQMREEEQPGESPSAAGNPRLNGKLLPIVDFRGFFPTPAHLPFAVWIFNSVISAYSDRVERLLCFGAGWLLSSLWAALKTMVPASSTSIVEFVDERTIWDWVVKDDFTAVPLHHLVAKRLENRPEEAVPANGAEVKETEEAQALSDID
ncbi:hypothetical protein DFJ74DRAFT_672397 [Hyaloraphidium curvatum]|nr:hypothetical protein DFJ74DRAFT_672397 [Hyaloraphidium curvatum]